MRQLSLILLLCFIFCSCKLGDEKEKSDAATGIKNIIHNLEKDKIDLFEAYIRTEYFLRKNSENQQAAEFKEELVKKMDQKALSYVEEEKYDKALGYLFSLKAINFQESSVDLKECFSLLINQIENTDNTSDFFLNNKYTINNLKEEMADLKLLSTNEVYDFLQYYYEEKSSGFFIHYLDKYSALYPDLLKKHPDLTKKRAEMANYKDLNFDKLKKAVITVVLDKGKSFKQGLPVEDISIGTGFFIDNEGHILTNHHVIADHVNPEFEGFSKVYIIKEDQPAERIPAKVIGYDKVFDLALLKVSIKHPHYIVPGMSKEIMEGQDIYTIGNPLGFESSITRGIISNKKRKFFQLGDSFQIDAAINQGNSGGPLINSKGEVIGVIFAGIPFYEGLNFAIPYHVVKKTIPLLFKGGEVKRSWIEAAAFEYRDNLMVNYVLPGGSAEMGGISEGDYILKIDGQEVKNLQHAQDILSWKPYPQLVRMEIRQGGQVKEVVVKLTKRPYLPVLEAFDKDSQSRMMRLVFGLEVDYYTNQYLHRKYTVRKVYPELLYQNYIFARGSIDFRPFDIGEGDPVIVYDLKYSDEHEAIVLVLRYIKKSLGMVDRLEQRGVPAGLRTFL